MKVITGIQEITKINERKGERRKRKCYFMKCKTSHGVNNLELLSLN